MGLVRESLYIGIWNSIERSELEINSRFRSHKPIDSKVVKLDESFKREKSQKKID